MRTIILRSDLIREAAMKAVASLPLDPTFEIEIREHKTRRNNDQNSRMWVRLNEIASQAWIQGRQYDADTLHEYCKREFLPETCYQGVSKWTVLPNGERALRMSTGHLTVSEFADYLTQIEAFGAELGVLFSANPRESYA